MDRMTVNQITAMLAIVVLGVVALLMWALALVLERPDVPVWQPVQYQPAVSDNGART